MIVESTVWCIRSRSRNLGNESESAAYGLVRQSFSIGAVEFVIQGVVSVGFDGVVGIVNGGDDEMGEEGQHGSTDAATFL